MANPSTGNQFAGLGRSSLGPAFHLGVAQRGIGSVSGGSLPPNPGRRASSRNAPLTGHARHGSGAPYTIRSTSRDADRAERRASREESLRPDEAAVRVLPVGRQEAADWAAALDIVVNRLVTVERSVREQAQCVASVKDRLDGTFGQVQELTHQTTTLDKNFREACSNIEARYTLKSEHNDKIDTIDANFGAIITRLDTLNAEFQILQDHVVQGVSASAGHPTQHSGRPPTYALNTPVNPERPEPVDGTAQWEATVNHGGSPLRAQAPEAPAGAAPPPAVVESSQRFYCRDPYVEPARELAPPQCQVPQTWLPTHTAPTAHQAPSMK